MSVTKYLTPGNVKINRAEFLAALITCETFARYCTGKLTKMALDNQTARSWFDAARCPVFPFDKYAQGTHMYMIELSMKVWTCWISTAMNKLADTVSRRTFMMSNSTHMIAKTHLRKVKPRWRNVIKFV